MEREQTCRENKELSPGDWKLKICGSSRLVCHAPPHPQPLERFYSSSREQSFPSCNCKCHSERLVGVICSGRCCKVNDPRSGRAVWLNSVEQQGGAAEQAEPYVLNVRPGVRLCCVSAGEEALGFNDKIPCRPPPPPPGPSPPPQMAECPFHVWMRKNKWWEGRREEWRKENTEEKQNITEKVKDLTERKELYASSFSATVSISS